MKWVRSLKTKGFTLVETMITIALLGFLGTLSVPVAEEYRLRAEYTVLKSALRVMMDGEDMYFIENGHFFPENKKLDIKSSVPGDLAEIGYSLPAGHKHRFIISSKTKINKKNEILSYYIEVRTDTDFNRNGKKDRFRFTTLYRNGELIRYRDFRQYK